MIRNLYQYHLVTTLFTNLNATVIYTYIFFWFLIHFIKLLDFKYYVLFMMAVQYVFIF